MSHGILTQPGWTLVRVAGETKSLEELVIESIDKHPNELHGKPATDPPDNLEHIKWGQRVRSTLLMSPWPARMALRPRLTD